MENKKIKDKIKEDNYKVFALLSNYLNNASDLISQEAIREIVKCGVSYGYDAQKHMTIGKYDFVFTDLWHDVSDGIDMYIKMKKYEKQLDFRWLTTYTYLV